jgi:GAF domain-containing protein
VTERLQEILDEFGVESGTIHLLGPDGHLHLAASINIPEAVARIVAVVPIGKGMAGLAAERREPVSICNIQTDTSGDVRPGARATGMEGAIAVPILREGELGGVLGIASPGPRVFTENEMSRLLALARDLPRRP